MKEENYIRYRRLKAFFNRICFYICRIFPVKRNLISICTFEGKGGFGCNPKYVAEELHRREPSLQFVWFVNDRTCKFPDYIRRVPNTLWSRAYWLSTSKIWIDNYRKPYGTCKRKGQYYINTWHANIGFKSIGLWRGDAFSQMAYLVSRNDSDMIDDVLIDSKFCEVMFPKGLVYDGTFLKTGQPRCDILYGDRKIWRQKFRQENHIPEQAKVVMFAPTFREGAENGKRTVFSEVWSLDFSRMLKNLTIRFGGEWYLCVRVHPQLAASEQEYQNQELKGRVIDVSRRDDMYEILAGMDVFVTDYSSAAMDAGYSHMPVFIYADDIDIYIKERGSMLWNLSTDPNIAVQNNQRITPEIMAELPYPIAQNNEELEKRILHFDEVRYLERAQRFEKAVQLVFDGRASERVADRILEKIHG